VEVIERGVGKQTTLATRQDRVKTSGSILEKAKLALAQQAQALLDRRRLAIAASHRDGILHACSEDDTTMLHARLLSLSLSIFLSLR
jgi:hypothetical protein